MEISWDKDDGCLMLKSMGCYDCSGEETYLTPEEFDELLTKRPPKREEVSI